VITLRRIIAIILKLQ